MKTKFKGWPYLIGLDHGKESKYILSKLYKFIDEHAKKSTLFIEITQDTIDSTQKLLEKNPKTHFFGIDWVKIPIYAKSKGMKVVPLIRRFTHRPLGHELPEEHEQFLLKKFVYHDSSEKSWMHKLNIRAGEGDIVVAHPSHIEGLVKHYFYPKTKILWKQKVREALSQAQRLTPEEKQEFDILRKKERLRRQLKIERKKGINLIR